MTKKQHAVITIRVPDAMHEQLRRAAYEQKLSINEIVRRAINKYLD